MTRPFPGDRTLQHTSGEYDALLDQIEARLADESDLIANIAVFSALLFDGIEAVDWTGVYFLRGDELVLGPFQGRAAPARIPLTHPTLGRAAREGRSIVTEDMAAFAFGDDELPARSQTAVPLFIEDGVIGLLVVDSPFVGRFGDEDRIGLEAAAELLVLASDLASLRTMKPSGKRKATAAARENTAQGKFSFGRFGLPTATQQPRTENGAAGTLQISITDDDLRKRSEVHEQRPLAAVREEIAPRKIARKSRARKVPSRSALLLRRVILFASAAIFLTLALSGAVYDATSPGDAPWHVPLRKLYSIIAFTWVGFFLCISFRAGVRRAAATVAGFSAIIEVGQYFAGSHEGVLLNVIDIVCGAAGGYFGALGARAARKAKYRK